MPLDKKGNPILYKPWVNKTKSNFKYFVYVKANNKKGFKKIGFGNKDYQQYKDKLGFYKKLDHNDPVRRKSYLARAKGIKNKEGNITWKDKNSANYYAVKFLW
jgi:hypothetical protein